MTWNRNIPKFHCKDNNIMNAFCQQSWVIYIRNNTNRKKTHWECHKALLWYRKAGKHTLPMDPFTDFATNCWLLFFWTILSPEQNQFNYTLLIACLLSQCIHHFVHIHHCNRNYPTETVFGNSPCLGPFHCFPQFLNEAIVDRAAQTAESEQTLCNFQSRRTKKCY